MKIAIAINGEGRGHLSRARAVAEILGRTHDISFRAPEHLLGEIARLFPRSEVAAIPYFSFVQRGFSVDCPRTVAANARLFLGAGRYHARIARELRREGVRMVLSDFEPFTSRAARLAGIPVLQLNHPGIVTRIGGFSPASVAARIVSRYMMACADKTLICSFFNGDVGPIVREELRNSRTVRGDYFVVYQKPLYREILKPVLDRAGIDLFKIFPDPGANYAEALAGSAGLIAPAGHQSISEAIALGKPVFAIPVKNQYEQELNARKLRASGFGDFCYADDLPTGLPRFISGIGRYETAIDSWRKGSKSPSQNAWSCQDETLRAVGMIEQFMQEVALKSAWNGKRPAASLLASIAFTER